MLAACHRSALRAYSGQYLVTGTYRVVQCYVLAGTCCSYPVACCHSCGLFCVQCLTGDRATLTCSASVLATQPVLNGFKTSILMKVYASAMPGLDLDNVGQ